MCGGNAVRMRLALLAVLVLAAAASASCAQQQEQPPGSRFLVYTRHLNSNRQALWIARVDGTQPRPLVPQGIFGAVSPDGRELYLVDTLKGTIERAEIGDDGTLGEPQAFVRIDSTDGHPDGPTIDSEGCVWIGLYAGWETRRYSPAGELIQSVRFPVANITKIALGGDDLRTAYATTARQQMSPEAIAKQPQIGDLFEFRVDAPGVPCPLVRY